MGVTLNQVSSVSRGDLDSPPVSSLIRGSWLHFSWAGISSSRYYNTSLRPLCHWRRPRGRPCTTWLKRSMLYVGLWQHVINTITLHWRRRRVTILTQRLAWANENEGVSRLDSEKILMIFATQTYG